MGMKSLSSFCDLSCRYAKTPDEEGLDGSGSCRTFTAIYCTKKKCPVAKAMPCTMKRERPTGCNGMPDKA